MNPLNRKMFRQPGMSRQPAGILASSPELSNVVRQRMGQPVQMAHGGLHVPRSPMGRVSTSRRPVPGDVRIPLVDALPKSGFARPALDDFLAARGNIPSSGIGAIRGKVRQDALTDLAMQSIRQGGTPFGDFAERGIQGPPNIDAMGNVNISTDDAMQAAMQANVDTSGPSLIDRGIAAARDVGKNIASAVTVSPSQIEDPSKLRTRANVGDRLSSILDYRGALRPDEEILDFEINTGKSSVNLDDVETTNRAEEAIAFGDEFGNIAPDGTMPGETLAATATTTPTDGVPRKVSTVNPKTTTAVQKLNDNLANVKGDVFNPEDQKNLTANEATNPKVVEEFTFKTAGLIDPKSVDLEDIDKVARDTMGFDPKAAGKKKEEAFWMGLMKAGLAIAAGGSENAMTNIAKGLSYGLDSYSKDIATLNEQERADRKEFRQLKTQMIRDERSYNLTIAGIKNTHAQSKVAAENQFKKNKIDIGFKRADAIRQDQRIANEQAYKEATLEADTLYKIRLMEQGDEKIQISKEALESKSFKTFKDAKIVDEKGEPTALGLEIYETPQGVAEAMINNDLRTTIKPTVKDKDTDAIKEQYGLTDAQARIIAGSQSALLKDYGTLEVAIKALGFNKPAAPQKVVVDPSQLKSK